MGLGVNESVYQAIVTALTDLGLDPEDYGIETEDGLYFIPFEVFDLINWSYDEVTGGLFNLNLRPSQNGYFIGNF